MTPSSARRLTSTVSTWDSSARSGSSPGAVTVASTMGKYVDVHFGTSATGPLLGAMGGAPTSSVRFVDVSSGNSFGIVNLGGGVKGTSQGVSFIGGDAYAGPRDGGTVGDRRSRSTSSVGPRSRRLSGTVDVFVGQTGITSPVVKVARRHSDALGRLFGRVPRRQVEQRRIPRLRHRRSRIRRRRTGRRLLLTGDPRGSSVSRQQRLSCRCQFRLCG